MQQHQIITQLNFFQPDPTEWRVVVDSKTGEPRCFSRTLASMERIAREMEKMCQARMARQAMMAVTQ